MIVEQTVTWLEMTSPDELRPGRLPTTPVELEQVDVRHAQALDWEPGTSETVMLAQVRSIALDLMQATGLSRGDALAAMRA